MITALRTSLSGLNAASESMAAHADNIVNARTSARVDEVDLSPAARGTAPPEDVFRPYRVSNQSVRGGGVKTEVTPVDPSHEVVYDPTDANADETGQVALPNVNLDQEVVGMSQDRTYWMANLAVMRTADEMSRTLLDETA